MSEIRRGRACNICGTEKLEDNYCPKCKKDTAGNIFMELEDTLIIHEEITIRKKTLGIKDWVLEIKEGWIPSGDAIKHPKGVLQSRKFDREKKRYDKVIKDYVTNEIIVEKHENLLEHKDTTKNQNYRKK